LSSKTGHVFLFDVDNTLFDNDWFRQDLGDRLRAAHGEDAAARYWHFMDEAWGSLGYMDYFGALARLRIEDPHDFEIFRTANWIMDYPFADRLYPHAIDVVAHAQRWALPVILSDGDAVLQPRKIMRSGLLKAFDDNALIYIHKEKELDDVARRYPADHYAFVDDKSRILSAVKLKWGARVTTIFPKQGHYAREEPPHDPASVDRTIEAIGDLLSEDWASLAG
jgi:FMN phosphatase YigB (HAD superfamily)